MVTTRYLPFEEVRAKPLPLPLPAAALASMCIVAGKSQKLAIKGMA